MVHVAGDTVTERDLATLIAFQVDTVGMNDDDDDDTFDQIFLESPHKQEADATIQQMVVLNPQPEDSSSDINNLKFETVRLLPEACVPAMMKLYTTFTGGEALNLSVEEIAHFQALGKDATQAQIETTLGHVLQGRFLEYQQRGLAGISPYRRAKKHDFYPGKELIEKTQKSTLLHEHAAQFGQYIAAWPHGTDPQQCAQETFGWMNYNLDNAPSIALYHRIIWTDPTYRKTKFLMHRTYYVSSGHNSVQQLGFAVPVGRVPNTTRSSSVTEAATDPPTTTKTGLLVGFSSRTSTDKVTGFGGSAKRAIGSRIMGGRIAENMEALRKVSASHKKKQHKN